MVGGKNGETLAMVVFKNDRLGRWGHKRSSNREPGQPDGLGNEVVRWDERAIAESKIQVGKGFRPGCVFEIFLIGQGRGRHHNHQDKKDQTCNG